MQNDDLRTDPRPFDAVLLVSFGGPEKPEDVVPFLENVTRGRGIPKERLVEVGQHYFLFGGRSPINDQNRAFLAAMRADFANAGLDLPIYWGNRNWAPYLGDTETEGGAGARGTSDVRSSSASDGRDTSLPPRKAAAPQTAGHLPPPGPTGSSHHVAR